MKEVTENVEIPFEIEYKNSGNIIIGTEEVEREGQPGEKQFTYSVQYIGDKELGKKLISEEVLTPPISKIVIVGTAEPTSAPTPTPVPVQRSTNGVIRPSGAPLPGDEEFTYTQKITMSASAYTAGPESTGKSPGSPGYGRTASGRMVEPGIVAVDPNVIPLGTRLYVEGYGYSLAADTGGAIKGNKIDLYYESLSDALRFGRRTVTVYVLD
jgi:3D (Asp-Asp-Asp) domain-containing protein